MTGHRPGPDPLHPELGATTSHNVTLPRKLVAWLRKVGAGNLSRGIREIAIRAMREGDKSDVVK